jgi:hypothetical protein
MAGFEADLPAISAAASTLRSAVDALDVDLSPGGDVGPGRLGPAVAALLATASADVSRARSAVTDLSDEVTRAGDAYTELDTNAANRFDQAPW